MGYLRRKNEKSFSEWVLLSFLCFTSNGNYLFFFSLCVLFSDLMVFFFCGFGNFFVLKGSGGL